MSGSFKTVLLDNAEAIREDFQQALRRVMEQHHRTTQFVIATRQPTKLIPPIRSRCFPVPVRTPTTDETAAVLRGIVEAEGVEYDDDGLEYIAGYADGDLREAVLAAQTTAAGDAEITMNAAYEALGEVSSDDDLRSVLDDVTDGSFRDARKTIGTLLDDEGYDGGELLRELLRVARTDSSYDDESVARLHRLAGEIDLDLAVGGDDRTHLCHLLATWVYGDEGTERLSPRAGV
jgi:replication factor C small subunit